MSTNKSIIDQWSTFSQDDLKIFGEGDSARQKILDPTILELLGDVKHKTILDAGCGNGYLPRKLAGLRANMTGIEPAETLFQYCISKEKEAPLGIKYIQDDICAINIIGQFDITLAINVFMDIPDYKIALQKCIDSLKPGGILIYSILHPCFPGSESDWHKLNHVEISEYFKETSSPQKYGRLFNRPLQEYINTTIDSGCILERIIEPQLLDNTDSRNNHVPQFIFIKAQKLIN